MNKILIIGAQGMLGQELLKIFPQAVGWDREEIDITDEKQVKQKISDLKPAVVINAAAYNAVDACGQDAEFELAKKINGYALGYLADVCLTLNATLVHYSTNYVFAGDKKDGYQESEPPNPVNKYGQSKLLGEREILRRSNLKYYLIRTSKLFGAKGKSTMAKENFFAQMLRLSTKQIELRVVDDELSNFTYAPDLVQATNILWQESHASGIYHLVNANPRTWYEGARALFDILGKKVKLIPVAANEFPRPAKRPKYGTLLNTKFPKLRDYEEALEEYLKDRN